MMLTSLSCTLNMGSCASTSRALPRLARFEPEMVETSVEPTSFVAGCFAVTMISCSSRVRLISLLLGESVGVIYKRKSRLKFRLKESVEMLCPDIMTFF